jgi:hypothetical protein
VDEVNGEYLVDNTADRDAEGVRLPYSILAVMIFQRLKIAFGMVAGTRARFFDAGTAVGEDLRRDLE